MSPQYFKAQTTLWADARAAMASSGAAWPKAMCLLDLGWWADQVRMGYKLRIPTSRVLAIEWGVGHKVARNLMRREHEWAALEPVVAGLDAVECEGHKRGTRRAQLGHKKGTPAAVVADALSDDGHKKGTEGAQEGHKRGNARDPIPTEQSRAEQKPTASAAEPASDLNLGKGLTAGKVNPSAVAVFTDWQQRQKQPRSAKLTKARHSLLISALGDYSTEELRHVVAFAYDAPIGAGGIPDGFARAWRGDGGQKRPGLEMLFRRSNVARNIEMSAEWSPTGTAQGHPAAPAADRLATPGHWWERMSQEGSGGIRRVRMEAEARHGAAWWDIMRRVLNDAGVDGSWFDERQYKPRDERDQRRAAFVESFNRRHA